MKIFSIEQNKDGGYRFRSLFNECVGTWCSYKAEAIEDGEKHQKIIEAITKTDFSTMEMKK